MLKAFLEFIKNNALFHRNDKILLAVSGGVDSVVLASLFFESGFNFEIAHCNFKLRGAQSDADEVFVKTLATNYNVGFHVKHFDTAQFSIEHNVSIEMAARELRYLWFTQIANQFNFEYVALAHHLNDSLETLLFNLTRGTGIAGLRGIQIKRDNFVRPLLFATRGEIEKYANENTLSYRQDESNFSDIYRRNFIRSKVVPLLKQLNPKLEHSVANTIERLQVVDKVFNDYLKAVTKKAVSIVDTDVYIDPSKIEFPQRAVVLAEILKAYNFSYSDAKQIVASVTNRNNSGKLFFSSTHVLNCDRKNWIVSTIGGEGFQFEILEADKEFKNEVLDIKLKKVDINDFRLSVDKNIAALDFSKLTFPLIIRQWRNGDYFMPLGMKGKKKLSDFMIDAKIPVNLKKRVFVIESDGKIAWVIGQRIDDRFKVTDKTVEVYVITNGKLND